MDHAHFSSKHSTVKRIPIFVVSICKTLQKCLIELFCDTLRTCLWVINCSRTLSLQLAWYISDVPRALVIFLICTPVYNLYNQKTMMTALWFSSKNCPQIEQNPSLILETIL